VNGETGASTFLRIALLPFNSNSNSNFHHKVPSGEEQDNRYAYRVHQVKVVVVVEEEEEEEEEQPKRRRRTVEERQSSAVVVSS